MSCLEGFCGNDGGPRCRVSWNRGCDISLVWTISPCSALGMTHVSAAGGIQPILKAAMMHHARCMLLSRIESSEPVDTAGGASAVPHAGAGNEVLAHATLSSPGMVVSTKTGRIQTPRVEISQLELGHDKGRRRSDVKRIDKCNT